MVKNTFLRRAAAEVGYPDLADNLNGQTAIVTGESDVCAAAKILKNFSAEFQKPAVKIGVLDKAVISKEQIRALADLPPKEILQAQLLGVLKSPLQKLVTLLNEPGASLARLLKARVEKEVEPARTRRLRPSTLEGHCFRANRRRTDAVCKIKNFRDVEEAARPEQK